MSKIALSLLPLLSLLLLLALFSPNFPPTFLRNSSHAPTEIHAHKHFQLPADSACDGTLYPNLCVSTVATLPELRRKTLPELISHTINAAINDLLDSTDNCTSLRHRLHNHRELRAVDDCLELFVDTVFHLNRVLSDLSSTEAYNADLQTVLSAALTNQDTCLDGLAAAAHSKRNTLTPHHVIGSRLRRISRHLSNSLAMVKKLKENQAGKLVAAAAEEEEEFTEYGGMRGGFPAWVSGSDRRILEAVANETRVDLVVAQDGSGDFATVNEAVAAAPNNSKTRFVIYVKSGAYFEYVEVDRKKTNIMLLGDGIGKTWIKGNRNFIDGWTTFTSFTVAILGQGFIAKGISFENYAGPSKYQAVAVSGSADFSAFYQCSFIGYQDTLYVHTFRQFYRDCDVYGTIDFIFGNAAVVLQNCNLYARRPNPNQRNIFTAQGRVDLNQNTGISVLNCKVAAAADLLPVLSTFATYLGRPWKPYSRTVFMFSNLESVVHPKGWLEWDGDFALDTLYYGEYMNRGPGSNTSDRVTWPGYLVINSSTEASQFTVDNFIQGSQWLPATGIPFYPNLTQEYIWSYPCCHDSESYITM